MKPLVHPAVFLGAVILLCATWLWARPPAVAAPTLARGDAPRPAVVEPASIALDTAILQRYAGRYEGRGGFAIDVTMKDGNLFAQSVGTMPSIRFELLATSQTEFFLKVPNSLAVAPVGVAIEFDVARDGTVRGLAANTELGLIEVNRVR